MSVAAIDLGASSGRVMVGDVGPGRLELRAVARRLARALRLPRTSLDCGGLCHGTMTMWFNHRFDGSALTVEYGARPSRHRMSVQAPRQLLDALRAHRPR